MNKRRFLRRLESALGETEVIDAATISKIDAMLWVLYPGGIKPDQYADMVYAVRALERLCAAANAFDDDDARASAPVDASSPSARTIVMSDATGETAREPAPAGAVVQAVEDDATAPISSSAFGPASDAVGSRPWTSLGEFSLSKSSPEKRRLVSHYASLLEHPVNRESDAIVIAAEPPSEASNG